MAIRQHLLCRRKGTYVRSLARDIGQVLGSAAHVVFLERRAVGRFKIEDAIDPDFFNESVWCNRRDFVIPVMTVLDDIPALAQSRGRKNCDLVRHSI